VKCLSALLLRVILLEENVHSQTNVYAILRLNGLATNATLLCVLAAVVNMGTVGSLQSALVMLVGSEKIAKSSTLTLVRFCPIIR
jgi:hypothetical protein